MRKLLSVLCSAIAAVALFSIMWLTLFDVSGRKLLSQSVPGSLELTELLMVAVIFAGLPLVTLQGGHVVFDSLDALLPRLVRRVQQVVVDLFCLACLAGLAWVMWTKAGQMVEYGDQTSVLKIPLGPFVYVMSALIAVTALVHAMLVFKPVAHHHAGVPDDEPAEGSAL